MSAMQARAATPIRIRVVDAASSAEIELVATRMRETLVEVLGEERGSSMYSLDWLVARARFHLDASACTGQIFVSESELGRITGHTIVRVETDPDGVRFGLFSTTYVEPAARRTGVAGNLLRRGEQWMIGHGLGQSKTYTDPRNRPLIELFRRHGYALAHGGDEFALLSKQLGALSE